MKYQILTIVVITIMLTGCKGEGKPGQYPPSLYQEREGTLTDAELEKNKKQAAETAAKVYPADDPAAPHAKSAKELTTEKLEKAYPSDDPAAPHAKSDKELTTEKVEKAYPADDPAAPHAKSEEEHKTDDDDAHPAEDKTEPRRGGY